MNISQMGVRFGMIQRLVKRISNQSDYTIPVKTREEAENAANLLLHPKQYVRYTGDVFSYQDEFFLRSGSDSPTVISEEEAIEKIKKGEFTRDKNELGRL